MLLVSGGYSWTFIPVDKCDDYMEALEKASVDTDIEYFSNFLATLVEESSNNH